MGRGVGSCVGWEVVVIAEGGAVLAADRGRGGGAGCGGRAGEGAGRVGGAWGGYCCHCIVKQSMMDLGAF